MKRCIYFYTLNFSDLLRFTSPTPRGMRIETSNLTSPSSEDGATEVSRRPVMHPAFQGSEALRIELDLKSTRKITRNLCVFYKTPAFCSMAKGGGGNFNFQNSSEHVGLVVMYHMGIERIQKKIHSWIYQESVLRFCTCSIQLPKKQQSTIEEGHQAILKRYQVILP